MASPAANTTDLELGMAIETKHGIAAISNSSLDGSKEDKKTDKSSYSTKEDQGTTMHVSGQWKIILGQSASVTGLMCGIAVSILVLIPVFELKSLKVGGFPSNDYIFLRHVPASAIICVASLAGLLSIVLVRSLLKLCSFPLAHDLLIKAERGDHGVLPSTQDFSIVVRALTGSPHAYIQAWRHSFDKGNRGKSLVIKVAAAYSYAVLFRLVILCYSLQCSIH